MAEEQQQSFADTSKKQSSFNLFEGWKTGKKGISFFDKIQDDDDEDEEEEDVFEAVQPDEKDSKDNKDDDGHDKKKDDGGGWSKWVDTFKALTAPGGDDVEGSNKALEALVKKSRDFHAERPSSGTGGGNGVAPTDGLQKLQAEFKMVFDQMQASFGDKDLDIKLFNPISFNYFLEHDESTKTPSWKRRKHYFHEQVEDMDKVYALHDALYLTEVSYLDTVEDITEALESYQGASYLLVYCQTEAEPREPAHFVAIKKQKKSKKKGFTLPWQKKEEDVLEVLFVVRGTKEISDMLSDCLLESREYEGGYAHDGVCQSGLFLVEKQTEFLEHLLAESGRDSIRLSLLGHSLGAGAAAIACIEFNKNDKIDATCIGFGCPALLTKEVSQQWESKITTVICDADCVPRMSKATVSNLMLDIMSHDWTARALEDVQQLINVLKINIPFELPEDKVNDATQWVTDYLSKEIAPGISKINSDRSEIQLFPPGKCIHMYRNGQGVSMHYVPCDMFDQFDVCYTMVDDHLIPTGYNRLMHDFARDRIPDSTFFFRNDINVLRAESHRKKPKTKDEDDKHPQDDEQETKES